MEERELIDIFIFSVHAFGNPTGMRVHACVLEVGYTKNWV